MTGVSTLTEEQLKELESAKHELNERFSETELKKLRMVADILRTPMNRKQRRALATKLRRAA